MTILINIRPVPLGLAAHKFLTVNMLAGITFFDQKAKSLKRPIQGYNWIEKGVAFTKKSVSELSAENCVIENSLPCLCRDHSQKDQQRVTF